MKIIQDYTAVETTDLIEIIAADYIGSHSLKILFNDKKECIVSFKNFLSRSLHPSISKYLDEALFQKFKITDGNLNWNDYDLIFPIHELYEGTIS
jgi:hypothetical protein